MTSPKPLLEFIARLTFNIAGLPPQLKLSLSQFLNFHFSKHLSKSQIQDIENRKASSPLSTDSAMKDAASSLSTEERIFCLATLHWLQAQAERVDDRMLSRRIATLSEKLTNLLTLQDQMVQIKETRHVIEAEADNFRFRPVVSVAARIWPIVLDYVLRWILLLGFSYWGIDKSPLVVFNVLIIPGIILSIAYWMGKKDRLANKELLGNYGGEHTYRLVYVLTTGQYTWLVFFFGTSIFISYLLPGQIHLAAFFGLAAYYFVHVRFLPLGRLAENDLIKQIEHKDFSAQDLTVDENDEVIVGLETKLNSSTSRLEAYVLESALFGALSFSGFLQIMATDLVSFVDLENFANYIFQTTQAFIHFDWQQMSAGLAGLNNKKSLFCLVSVESLVCSIFFLAVIASRLRFSDIADRVRTAINLAKAYNTKEEELIHDENRITSESQSRRLQVLTAKVNEQLQKANWVLGEIGPVMRYMQYFRNAGILVFLVILISSSLFITGFLSWVFIALTLATSVYFNAGTINHSLRAFFLIFRIQFVKHGYWLFGLAILPRVLAYVFTIFFNVGNTNWLFALSHVLVSLYIFSWLLLAAHVDEQFGDIEERGDQSRLSRWKVVRNTIAILILSYGIGLAFKELHLVGADQIMMLSLNMLALLMYFVGYYLTRVRWLGILVGGVIAIASIGILFKTLHLTGADQMILVAGVAFAVWIPVVILKRKLFHELLIRFCIVGLIITIWYNPIFSSIPLSLELAYQHRTTHTAPILSVVQAQTEEDLQERGRWYMKEYDTIFGFTAVHRHLVVACQDRLEEKFNTQEQSPLDSLALVRLLALARFQKEVIRSFDYENVPGFVEFPMSPLVPIEMEANVLLAMKRDAEAVASLQEWLSVSLSDEARQRIEARIAEISTRTK